ncbi:MAG: SDR family oxidoreductase [Ruminococcus sp.]|nr:SDR family oxidoreductase [Ruminococcus sp.]
MKRVILVTGASRGLGRAIALAFLENKDIVYINYNNTSKEEVESAFKKYDDYHLVNADLKNEEEIKMMINKIKKEQGYLDVLVNNAGIAIDTTLEDKTKENFKEILDVNLIGPFLVSKYAKDIMDKGSIINISSNTALDAYYPYGLDYDASKAGLISLTHNLAVLFAPNIRVNAVAPGWINTDMNKELDSEYIKTECERILVKRFAEPIEIAKVVFFLASEDASYINNEVIRVDGGFYG